MKLPPAVGKHSFADEASAAACTLVRGNSLLYTYNSELATLIFQPARQSCSTRGVSAADNLPMQVNMLRFHVSLFCHCHRRNVYVHSSISLHTLTQIVCQSSLPHARKVEHPQTATCTRSPVLLVDVTLFCVLRLRFVVLWAPGHTNRYTLLQHDNAVAWRSFQLHEGSVQRENEAASAGLLQFCIISDPRHNHTINSSVG
jgi:hypothetical protein